MNDPQWSHPDPHVAQMRKVTASRQRVGFFMTRSRAQLERTLTPSMLDAENEIETAFKIRAGHMGYGSHDPARTGRSAAEPEQDWQIRLLQKFDKWSKSCPKKYRNVVLDHLVFKMTMRDITEQRGIRSPGIAYRIGLKAYCAAAGMA